MKVLECIVVVIVVVVLVVVVVAVVVVGSQTFSPPSVDKLEHFEGTTWVINPTQGFTSLSSADFIITQYSKHFVKAFCSP